MPEAPRPRQDSPTTSRLADTQMLGQGDQGSLGRGLEVSGVLELGGHPYGVQATMCQPVMWQTSLVNPSPPSPAVAREVALSTRLAKSGSRASVHQGWPWKGVCSAVEVSASPPSSPQVSSPAPKGSVHSPGPLGSPRPSQGDRLSPPSPSPSPHSWRGSGANGGSFKVGWEDSVP